MAESLKLVNTSLTGSSNVYAVIVAHGGADDKKWWNGVGLEAFTDANYANYVLAMTEQADGLNKNGVFTVTVPAALAAGAYMAVAKVHTGTAGRLDAVKGTQIFEWDGSAIVVQRSLPALIFAYTIWTGWTFLRLLKNVAAVLLGKSSGMVAGSASSPVFRDVLDTTNQVTGTLDANGNRTATTPGS